jgi:hypothetical protein
MNENFMTYSVPVRNFSADAFKFTVKKVTEIIWKTSSLS